MTKAKKQKPPTRERIEVRLDLPLAERFHEARGDVPASTYIRRLIERDAEAKLGKNKGK